VERVTGRPERRVTIYDVARVAGVSHQTVSRVINGSPDVRKSTRDAVLDTIAGLGFRPNRAARALRGGPVQSISVLTSNTTLYGFTAALEGIEEATREVGFRMAVRLIESVDPADVRDAVEWAREPAGAVIVIATDHPGQAALDGMPPDVPAAAIVPFRPKNQVPARPSVWIDEHTGAREATCYLLKLGHKTVHHLSIPAWTGNQRMLGWRSALQDAGAPVPTPRHGGWSADWGYDAGRRLARDPEVTAVLCGNDEIALGAMHAMLEAGHAVPGQVSIVGFDDTPLARFYTPALTTVRQDFKALGKLCVANLLPLVGRGLPGEHPEHLEAHLVIRESAGPPGGSGTRPESASSAQRAPRRREF
jgi:DNA-binding LacI/PurR family transcriptional regulator